MVSERQSGLEPKTDPVDSEGVVEMLAEMVLSMEMLLLAVQHLVCCSWHEGRTTVSYAPMIAIRLWSQPSSSQASASMSRPKAGVCCKTRGPWRSSGRDCSYRMVKTLCSQLDASAR